METSTNTFLWGVFEKGALCAAHSRCAAEVNASHVAYMSHPKETAELIKEAAIFAHTN
jgi:hypothetical protein